MPSTTSLLVFSPLLLVIACTQVAEYERNCDDHRCDDLVGRDVSIVTRDGTIDLEKTSYATSPEVEERGNAIAITTDDFRLDLPKIAGYTYAKLETLKTYGIDSRYGFRLQYRKPSEQTWCFVEPVVGSEAWNWQQVIVSREPSGTAFSLMGTAMRFGDTYLGLGEPDAQERLVESQRYEAEDLELRVLVIPLWDFWDFDATGYEAVLDVQQCGIVSCF